MAPTPRPVQWARGASGAVVLWLSAGLPAALAAEPAASPRLPAEPLALPAAPVGQSSEPSTTGLPGDPEESSAARDPAASLAPAAQAIGAPPDAAAPRPARIDGPAGAEQEPPLELQVSANEQGYDSRLNRFVAIGNASALIAGGRVLADRIEYDIDGRTLYAIGSVRFQRGQQYLQASRLRYNLLELVGDLEDVYGVLDLDSTQQDLDLETAPAAPLPPPEPVSCTPQMPPLPDWHPYPWAVTAWGGQMVDANFGDTFVFQGNWRPEYLMGLGLQRRLLDGGPLALELDTNLMGHRAAQQPGGGFNQAVPFADTPSQSFGEITAGIGLRFWLRPWLNLYFVEGVSFNTSVSNYEKTFRENFAQFLNYLAFEAEALVHPQWSVVGRIHHRSGAYGTYSGVKEGSNAYLLGFRYRFGQRDPSRQFARLDVPMPPSLGCPGSAPPTGDQSPSLAESLEDVAMGPTQVKDVGTSEPEGPPSTPVRRKAPANVWQEARQREAERRQVIAGIDQRVSEVQFQQSFTAQRRRSFGDTDSEGTTQLSNDFGAVRPPQLQDLNARSNRQLVTGTITRWRFQAKQVRLAPGELRADRASFTNDPYTPAQNWLDSEQVVATLQPNGDTLIRAGRNRLILEDRLPIPVTRETRIQKQEEVQNRWVLGNDGEDRDGFFIGYKIRPLEIGTDTTLTLQPQFLVQRAIEGRTDSYPLPGEPAGASPQEQGITGADMFGLEAQLESKLLGFGVNANLDMSTFNPENIPDGTRSWGDLSRKLDLPLVGKGTLRLFGAYRYRVWNGSLGEQDIYSAYGISLEDKGKLPAWGQLSGNYFWRFGVGRYQANAFQSSNLLDLWRGNAIVAINASLPLWTGKPLPPGPLEGQANPYSATPVVPGVRLNANLTGTVAYFGDGTNQNTLSLSGGPTFTLGHFSKPFLDYTVFSITGGGTLREGVSPLSFDRAVDLGTLGVGLTQQLVGPLVLSGGIGLNVDPNSEFYGDVTGSYVELRWQRRAYEIGVFYSPYEQLGGIRVKLNDFNFKGPGTPFVPFHPAQAIPRRPF
ncbi:DUF3769 domain-containing protein [Synechococcus sp. CBW1107]|uniref:DUF3769 domain-containing protein n=1 Tax=Synechococcus sp. CBW1107 TaxID=2789857 RepID=UPI002AD57B91|nr:DUF3769 domain-containing protein [Synechococcus sp. CBW1107]